MQQINADSFLREMDERLKTTLDYIPTGRRELHTRISAALERELRGDMSAKVKSSGRVTGWQESRVGSGGGYAAISSIKGTGPSGKRADSPGAITNYLESGHRVRSASGTAKRPRKGRAKSLYVKGHYFYRDTSARARSIAVAEADAYVQEVERRLSD